MRIDPETGLEDHSDLHLLLVALQRGGNTSICDEKLPIFAESIAETQIQVIDNPARKEFERDLLVAPNGRQLYVEPQIYEPYSISIDDIEAQTRKVTVEEIIKSSRSTIINAPHEYGLTSLGRRLVNDFSCIGVKAQIRDSQNLPVYKAKLEKDPAFTPSNSSPSGVIILDNFRFQDHERLLKEIIGIKRFSRIIILAHSSDGLAQIEDAGIGNDFDVFLLSHLQRSDIRTLASDMYNTSDNDLISGAVEKVYNDLLDLCIPLTPANVVMYLSVIFKEGDFIPLSRLQIIDRYVRELLRRPSDPYRDSFNVDNKLDIISLFVQKLYEKKDVTFTKSEWSKFCQEHMESSLVSFDDDSLLSDLSASRVLGRTSTEYFFKYKLFYSFFLGRYVANRPTALKAFLENNDHMQVESLVEVISGLSADNTVLVEDLCTKLEGALDAFDQRYALGDMDPYLSLEWTFSPQEDDATWEAVREQLAAGPAEASEVDKVKRSILSERRTEDQAVVIQDFSTMEKNISYNHITLLTAINNAVDIHGELKIRAMKALGFVDKG